MIANGRYAFASAYFGNRAGTVGTLIDERTGVHTRIDRPGCGGYPVALGGGWLALQCDVQSAAPGAVTELYDLARGEWRTVTLSKVDAGGGGVELSGVGTDWIAFFGSEAGCHGACYYRIFQNIQTGSVSGDPTDGHAIPALDSPILAQRICGPLRVPSSNFGPGQEQPFEPFGSLTFLGAFALSSDGYLEHCGSHLHERLNYGGYSFAAANARLVVSTSSRELVNGAMLDGIRGLLLPSRRRVQIPLPARLKGTTEPFFPFFELSARTLYYLNASGRLIAARLPARVTSN